MSDAILGDGERDGIGDGKRAGSDRFRGGMSRLLRDGSAKTIALQSSLSTMRDGTADSGLDGEVVGIGEEDREEERGGIYFTSSESESLDARLLWRIR